MRHGGFMLAYLVRVEKKPSRPGEYIKYISLKIRGVLARGKQDYTKMRGPQYARHPIQYLINVIIEKC